MYKIITDTHLGHTNLEKSCERETDATSKIMKNLELLKEQDILIHLGDVCFGNDKYWHTQIVNLQPKRKILVLGNHDKKSLSWYFNIGWDMVVNRFDLKVYGTHIAFSHEPLYAGDFELNIHGHIHNNIRYYNPSTIHKLIYIEHHYNAISLQKIVEGKYHNQDDVVGSLSN